MPWAESGLGEPGSTAMPAEPLPQTGGEFLDDHGPDVVPVPLIAGTGIPQPHDEPRLLVLARIRSLCHEAPLHRDVVAT
jgi:hypothetical protein